MTAETPEGVINQAKELLRFKESSEAQRPKTTREQFTEWLDGPQPSEGEKTLDEIAEETRIDAGGYPTIPDYGEVERIGMPDPRPVDKQFEEWFQGVTAFDPSKDQNGWKKL